MSEIQTKLCLAWFIARDTVPHTTAHRYIDTVRADEDNFWQQAITQARQLICHDRVKDDLAPNILGGLVGLLATSGNPVLVVVATPLAIHVFRETLDNFCD